MPGLIFAGDPHGRFEPLLRAVRAHRPDAVVLLGDLDLEVPLEEVLAPITGETAVYWIPGNHDADRAHWHDHLFHSGLADRNLHARVVTVGGVRIAGLGGVFRGQVWYPRQSAATQDAPSREQWLARIGKGNRWRGGLPRKHRVTIFPEDVQILASQRADILVTHEAPTCHRHGFAAIDELARSLGVRWIIHGHHHTNYRDCIEPDIQVVGVALAEVFWLAEGRW